MNSTLALLLLLAVPAAEDKPKPKFALGKETTYVDGPLDAEGYVDYEAALNDRLGKAIKPEKNASVLLWKNVFGPRPEGKAVPTEFFRRLGIEEPPKDGPYFRNFHTYLRETANIDVAKIDPDKSLAISDEERRTLQRPWKAKDYPHIAGWLKANEKPLDRAIEAIRLPDYYSPVIRRRRQESIANSPHPETQKCRELTAALTTRAMLRLAEGDRDGAWQDLLACHRLGRLAARRGTILENLFGIAVGVTTSNADLVCLEYGKPRGREIQDRLKELRSLPPLPSFADEVDLVQRIEYLDTMQLVRRVGPCVLGGTAADRVKKSDPAELRAVERIDWEPALRDGNRWFDRLVAALRIRDRARREKELGEIVKEVKALGKNAEADTEGDWFKEWAALGKNVDGNIGKRFLSLVIPVYPRVQHSHDRAEQTQRNLHVAFALAAYRSDHGRYPDKLDALAPGYLPTVPGDLFSGKELIYRPAEGGYLLNSVGADGKDEGGRSRDDDLSGDDLPVRMPLPKRK